MGLYISKFYGVRRRILPRDGVLACTGAVYDSIKLIDPEVTVTGVERCLKRHFNYSRYVFKTKKQAYKCRFDYSSLAGAVEDAIALGVKAVCCVLDKNVDKEVFSKRIETTTRMVGAYTLYDLIIPNIDYDIKMRFVSVEYLDGLLERTSKDNWYLEILLGLFCGLRKGEIYGLKFSDFDLERRSVKISRQIVANPIIKEGSRIEEKYFN